VGKGWEKAKDSAKREGIGDRLWGIGAWFFDFLKRVTMTVELVLGNLANDALTSKDGML